MKPDSSAESWLKFFTTAGIPLESSKMYAVTFSKHEIQLDMLSEINKEYLIEMGVSLMGHVIAILRHAKAVYKENVTKTTLSTVTASKNQITTVVAVPKQKPVLKTMPLKIATQKEDASSATTTTVSKSTVTPVESRLRAVGTSTVQSSSNAYGPHVKSSSLPGSDSELPRKKKESDAVTKTKITSTVSNVAVKKKNTEASHRQNDEVSSSKGKVFERLGEEVSSCSEVKTSDSSLSDTSSSHTESVFARLGVKKSPTYSSSTSPVKPTFKSVVNSEESLSDYPKIKRENGNKPRIKSVLCTMRADEAEMLTKRGLNKRTRSPSPANVSNNGDVLKSNIKSRLGKMARTVSPSGWLRSASGEKSIGLSDVGEFRSDKTVKSRLGQFDFSRIEGGVGNKGSILSKRVSPGKSIAFSGLKASSGIKSRLGRSMIKSTPYQKKVSFGSVEEQLIPLETKAAYRRQFNRHNSFLNWKQNIDFNLF